MRRCNERRPVRITDQHLKHLIDHGYAVVEKFLTADELAAATQNFLRYVPTPEELSATPERYPWVFEEADKLQTEFPFVGDALNHVSTHPDLINFVERALGTQKVLLSQAAFWAKYAGTGDFEQALHLDYEGNSLVVPRDDGSYRQINMILYYTDVNDEHGPDMRRSIRKDAAMNRSGRPSARARNIPASTGMRSRSWLRPAPC